MEPEKKHYGETIEILKTRKKTGLTNDEAERAFERFGENVIEEKKKTALFIRFLGQLNDFMIIVLLIAAGVSAGISILRGELDFADPIIILAIVILNAILGLIQESRAERSLEALRKMTAPLAKVIRDGRLEHIETARLVPGDIILLEQGDFVPADSRLIESINLKVEESALTGESMPVEKDADFILYDSEASQASEQKNMVFASTVVVGGRGKAVVCFTGMNTQVGKIARMILTDESPQTPLQKKLEGTGKILSVGALAICVVIFVVGVLRQMDPFAMFMTSVSLAVAAIPEGLPAIVTIMLAIGVQQMAQRNAIIRKLPAVETLGSATVICSDKTGTLTQNKMRVMELADASGKISGASEARQMILKLAVLCNNSALDKKEVLGDPTEAALVSAALNSSINKNHLDEQYKRVSEIPFDSKRKLMTTIHRKPYSSGYLAATKGAPDVLLERCSAYLENGEKKRLTEEKRQEILDINFRMAQKALRVLATAYKDIKIQPSEMKAGSLENGLIFAGLIGMIDPPRPEAKEAVAVCKRAGIKPVMVTGDHALTATAIAEKIGILEKGDKTLSGTELEELSQEELNATINEYSVYARLSPEHKVRIVKAYQNAGAVVAMTGDGVNDAPALKIADIGCAMGENGTDVAKSAADMVLADDNFATIVYAVKEGRDIYLNIKKAIHFLLSSNIGEIIAIFMAIIMGFDSPLLAIHLLWVNLVTDSLPAIALGLDPVVEDTMSYPPTIATQSFFGDGLWFKIIVEGIMVGMLSLLAFGIGTVYFDAPGSVAIGRTMAFCVLSIAELVHAFNMRSSQSVFKINIFGNVYLVGALLIGVVFQVALVLIPAARPIFKTAELPFKAWLIVAGLCLAPLHLVELEKLFTSKKVSGPKSKKSVAYS
jgi:Ca2+-transporting ATPase